MGVNYPTLSSSPILSREVSELRHLPIKSRRCSSTSLAPYQQNTACSSRDATPDNISLFESSTPTFPSSAISDPASSIQNEHQLQSLHKWTHEQSIVCVACAPAKHLLFCGTQDSTILVFDLLTYQKKTQFKAHSGTVLCLNVSQCGEFLFSGGSDSLVKLWDIKQINSNQNVIRPTHVIYSLIDIGDIFSIAWIQSKKTVFIGAQNASISYVHLELSSSQSDTSSMPSQRFDRFFDSKGKRQYNIVDEEFCDHIGKNCTLIEIPSENIISYAHYGYVYAMETISDINEQEHPLGGNIPEQFNDILISAGGDGNVKIWGLNNNNDRLTLLHSLDCEDPILSLAKGKTEVTLFCGLTDGGVKVWDLSTYQIIKSYETNEGDINSLGLYNNFLFKGTSESGATKWLSKGEIKSDWSTHNEKSCLAVKIFEMDNTPYLVTTGTDRSVELWNIFALDSQCEPSEIKNNNHLLESTSVNQMIEVLGKFVSYKTVSKHPELYIEQSRQCANFLRLLSKKLGAAKSQLLPVPDANPVVLSIFQSNKSKPNGETPRILWYGHYDVIEVADADNSWKTDPFTLTPINGYLYARGASDNKGPLLASMYAVSELQRKGELEADVVFLIEGEEEAGSFGFQDVVLENKEIIGEIDWVMLSNSYWLDDNVPCLNYGLRGVIAANVEIYSDKPDRHSGVDGGLSREPTIDLINILSKLNDDEGRVKLPNFYSTLKESTNEEMKLYDQITKKVKNVQINELMTKWRLPSLTIHKVNVSGPGNSTVIPQSATAALSIRIVPNQNVDQVKSILIDYITSCFDELKTENHLKIEIVHEAEPWLGDINNAVYKVLYENLQDAWKTEPLYIREGGSIPSIRFLEKTFNCEAAHLPAGQSSDNAHLSNERLRITNLFKTKEILQKTFNRLPSKLQQ